MCLHHTRAEYSFILYMYTRGFHTRSSLLAIHSTSMGIGWRKREKFTCYTKALPRRARAKYNCINGLWFYINSEERKTRYMTNIYFRVYIAVLFLPLAREVISIDDIITAVLYTSKAFAHVLLSNTNKDLQTLFLFFVFRRVFQSH